MRVVFVAVRRRRHSAIGLEFRTRSNSQGAMPPDTTEMRGILLPSLYAYNSSHVKIPQNTLPGRATPPDSTIGSIASTSTK